jgi:hypothetical protein
MTEENTTSPTEPAQDRSPRGSLATVRLCLGIFQLAIGVYAFQYGVRRPWLTGIIAGVVTFGIGIWNLFLYRRERRNTNTGQEP